MTRLAHPFRAGRAAAAAPRIEVLASLEPATSDGAVDAPAYVWPLNPWGGHTFRQARA